MKRIIMVRHASAAAKGPDVEDFTRSLRKKGHREAKAMISWYIKTNREIPDLMLSSPANRAIETALLFAKGLGCKPKKIQSDDGLYGTASNGDFLKCIKKLDDKYDSVMVFGHDPAFSDFAQYMVTGFSEDLPKCSVFAFVAKRKTWKSIRPGDGALEYFESPEGLVKRRERVKQTRKDLTSRIEDGIWNVLTESGIERSEDNRVRRASTRLAKAFVGRARLVKAETAEGGAEETSP